MADLILRLTPVLDAPDPVALGKFYRDFLGWNIISDESDSSWVSLAPAGEQESRLSIQEEPVHESPRWPSEAGVQQMQVHLDFWVADLAAAQEKAQSCGARVAETQFQDDCIVMLDPVGHPFCIFA